jgi:hypothetical protein
MTHFHACSNTVPRVGRASRLEQRQEKEPNLRLAGQHNVEAVSVFNILARGMNVGLLESDRRKENFRIRIAEKFGWFRRLGLCRLWESERALHTAIETHTGTGTIREGKSIFRNYNEIDN